MKFRRSKATDSSSLDSQNIDHPSGLRSKLWVSFLIQFSAISVATLLGVYGAYLVLRDVLIQRALQEEATYFWQRVEQNPNANLPDTYNMKSFLAPAIGTSGVPDLYHELAVGYHTVSGDQPSDDLVFVEDGSAGRLYLIFDQGQVSRLAIWFGFVPLALVLGTIYITTWLTYRSSRRVVSPIVWLANQVRQWDPKSPDFHALASDRLPTDVDGEVATLAGSLHTFATRIEDFVERERNFTRDASHELRTPLTVIKIAADVLQEETLGEYAQKSVQRIRRASRDMEALIEAFLILARESGPGLPEEEFCVNEIVQDQVDNALVLIRDKPVELNLVEQAQLSLHAPPRVLSVMLSNLIRNACLYTEQGKVTVRITQTHIYVEDTGPGMSDSELANATQAFFRAAPEKGAGFGIGLTIVKRLSQRFGLPFHLNSKLGEGTQASIEIKDARLV